MKPTSCLLASVLVCSAACAEPKTGRDLDGPGMADPATPTPSAALTVEASATASAAPTASASTIVDRP